jgi:hypothetical protein
MQHCGLHVLFIMLRQLVLKKNIFMHISFHCAASIGGVGK